MPKIVNNNLYDTNEIEINIEIDVQTNEWSKDFPDIENLAFRISSAVFKTTTFDKYATHIEFSIILAENNKVQELNKDYRGYDKPTNVLSFPAEEIFPQNFSDIQTHEGFILIGDIIFAYETVRDEAKNLGKTFEAHFSHLLIHGLLHLLGYDHETEEEANEMERIEVEILTKFNIVSPYQDH